MFVSVFELFRIGIGPSSSHTVGPMRAARMFLNEIGNLPVERVKTELFGSLALTGIGHGTDKAVLLGLEGYSPEGVDPDRIPEILQTIREKKQLFLNGEKAIPFEEDKDLLFLKDKTLPYHPNAMRITAFNKEGKVLIERVYYSIGGGFVLVHSETSEDKSNTDSDQSIPYPFNSAEELLGLCKKHQLTIPQLILENEKQFLSEKEIRRGILNIWDVMKKCALRGCSTEGILPGGLNVRRRAPILLKELKAREEKGITDPGDLMDWVSLWALAVNEENAAGGRVVTAPTNGAAGVIPAVMHYCEKFCGYQSDEEVVNYFLTATAIGILYKHGASISAAEMGCQGEIGVASSMAAAALAFLRGGTLEQVENAAEIAMEHHLGMTCDPVMGLVQIPCIERNTMGSIKAINAARLAMMGDGIHRVTLDQVIKAMKQTGEGMQSIFKETSLGGLAVNVPEC